MKKLFVAGLVFLLTGCTHSFEDTMLAYQEEQSPVPGLVGLEEIRHRQALDRLYLSRGLERIPREDVVSDFWLMVETLSSYSPVLDALDRVHGLDLYTQADRWYELLPTGDEILRRQAQNVFTGFLSAMSPNGIGHLTTFPTTIQPQLVMGWPAGDVAFWLRATQNGRSDLVFQAPPHYDHLMQEHGIAYIRMDKFSRDYIPGNVQALQAFFETIKDWDYLIIDLTSNLGGYMLAWDALFGHALSNHMSPEPVLLPVFFRGDASTRLRLRALGFTYSPTSEFDFDRFPEIEVGDFDNLEIFVDFTYQPNLQNYIDRTQRYFTQIQEGSTHIAEFEGEIFLLTSRVTGSAGDAVVRWARAYDFATIVGLPTGGLGGAGEIIPMGPIRFQRLNHVDMTLRIDLPYTINDVGRWSDEQGTLPDIWQAEGMSILGTAIDHIINRGIVHD